MRAMGQTAFTARQIGDAADVLEAMARDKDCFVVMTLSGALTVAKMGLVFCDLVESGIVKAIVSTGALMAHGLVEATGRSISATTPRWTTASFFSPATIASTIRSNRKSISIVVEESMQHILQSWDANEVVSQLEDQSAHRRISRSSTRRAAAS